MHDVGGRALVDLAEAIATFAHQGQRDKNGHDYIAHPRAVYYRVYADDEYDYDGQVVAWLHDVVEDTLIIIDDLQPFFPLYLMNALWSITFRPHNFPNESRDDYYQRVKGDPIALRVKLHDIAHNTSPKRMDKLPADVQARLKGKYAHALEVLQS